MDMGMGMGMSWICAVDTL